VFVHYPLPWSSDDPLELPPIYMLGVWLSILLAIGYISIYAWQITEESRQLADALAATELVLAREQHLSQLDGLAAAAAHELGTPLGTIAVLAEEALHDASATEESRRRAKVVAQQVERCRAVIAKMRTSLRAEGLRAGVDVARAVEQGVRAWQAAHPEARVEIRAEKSALRAVPLGADDIEAALSALLDNALHAMGGSTARAPIVVTVSDDRGAPVVSVEDDGAGVPPHLEGRIGEPFVTTKAPGEGMGLGLYLVRALLEPIGGRLEISARRPSGTRVALLLAAIDG
jgi:two-component system sensor histidine kinase RegB